MTKHCAHFEKAPPPQKLFQSEVAIVADHGGESVGRFLMENDFLRRELVFEPGNGLRTISLFNKETGSEYVQGAPACEFLLGINGQTLFGYSKPKEHVVDGNTQRSAFSLKLVAAKQSEGVFRYSFHIPEVDAMLTVCYSLELEPGFPAMSKWVEVQAGKHDLVLDKCFFEVINAWPGRLSDLEFFVRHGLERGNRMFVTRGFDDVLQAHNPVSREGWFIANTAPGPLNRFFVYPHWSDTAVSVGYTTDTTPFRKYLSQGEKFVSHRALTMLYSGERDCPGVRNRFRACLRRVLPRYLRDDFMYCTWIPFLKNINEALVIELAERAAELGMTTFVLDDGWFEEGDWRVDRAKFPNGLEPVAEKIRSLGMRFGLWFNIGTDYGAKGSLIEDNAIETAGSLKYGGFVVGNPAKCLASEHRATVAEKLLELARLYSVGYFKLDFSSIVSPYGLLPVGCHSTLHAWHRDGTDAVIEQYAGLTWIREQVKREFPELILDFSFESFGTDWPNVAALQSSELHHSSNLNTHDEEICGARDIRNALYRFGSLLPVERIMGSLICLQGERAVENLLTSLAGAPLLAGDIRELSGPDAARIVRIVQTMKSLTDRGPLTEFVKLRGDQHIEAGDWDGFARFCPDATGFLCLFRNESAETPVVKLDLPCCGRLTFRDMAADGEALLVDAAALRVGVRWEWESGRTYRAMCFAPENTPTLWKSLY